MYVDDNPFWDRHNAMLKACNMQACSKADVPSAEAHPEAGTTAPQQSLQAVRHSCFVCAPSCLCQLGREVPHTRRGVRQQHPQACPRRLQGA